MEFKISSELKNIIGKDLIVNDEVAIFELVKNAYDAHAEKVDIEFQQDKIIIRDNGKGMDINDLQDKWLFVAYSAKKDDTEDKELKENNIYKDYRDKINLKRGFAGAKGIGRFSSDRLGSKLKLISKKIHSHKIHQLDINWEDFEQDSKKEFINISVKYSTPEKTEYDNFNNGVILEISNLHSKWDDVNIEALKRSLGKLINPFEVNTKSNNFQIYIKRLNEASKEPIINEILSILTMKTTKLEVVVNKNKIISKLSDRDTLIYEIEEENNYKFIKNISITLLYLNQKAKYNFSKIMGVAPKNFGHVVLFNNGFRVYPYGETNDDSFGVNLRHQQGYNRFLSTRNIIGNININEYSNEFKEKSSRDSGLIETDGYNELYGLFWDKALKRLEKYVVGIQWSLEEIIRKEDNESENSTILENSNSKSKIIELISNLTDKESVKIKNFDSNFLNLLKDKIDPSSLVVSKLSKMALDINDLELINEIKSAKTIIKNLQKGEKTLKIAIDEGLEIIAKLETDNKELINNLYTEIGISEKLKNTIEQKEKQVLFFKSERTLNEDELINLQHHIGINADLINGSITKFKRYMDKQDSISKDKVLDMLDEISIANQKIIAINKYATKADFLTNSETINKDIIAFTQQYISNIHEIVSSNKISVEVEDSIEEFILSFKPMELTIIIDNIINNARKAKASKLNIKFNCSEQKIDILFIDNGVGLDKNIINPQYVFEKGFTTTKGSGLGLYHIQKIIARMKGDIHIFKNKIRGLTVGIGLFK